MDEMFSFKPEPDLANIDELHDRLNRDNSPQTIPSL